MGWGGSRDSWIKKSSSLSLLYTNERPSPQTRPHWHYILWWSVKEDHREYWKELMKIQPPYDLQFLLETFTFYPEKPRDISSWSDTNPHKKPAQRQLIKERKEDKKRVDEQTAFNKKNWPFLDPITGAVISFVPVRSASGKELFPGIETSKLTSPDGDTIRDYIGKLKDGWIPKKPWTYIPKEHNTYIYKDGITDEGQKFLFPLTKHSGVDKSDFMGTRPRRPKDLRRDTTIQERKELARIETKKEIKEEKRKLGPELYMKHFPNKDQPLDVDEMRKIQEDMPKTWEGKKYYEKMKKLFYKEVSTSNNEEGKIMKTDNYYEDGTDERTKLQAQIESIADEEKAIKKEQKKVLDKKKNQLTGLQEQLGNIGKDQSDKQKKAIDNDRKAIDALVEEINTSWNISRQEIIKTAVILYEAKVGVKKIHGASWTFLTEKKLPFGKKTADRLAQIGGCSFVVDNIDGLPAAYTTLYEISLLPEWMFDEAFAANRINQTCWKKDIVEIKEQFQGKEPTDKKEQKAKSRTLPIGIINVPKDDFEMTISKEGEDDKTYWDPDKIEAFQLKVINSIKTLSGATVDFSKIDETLETQEEKRLGTDPVKDTLKVLPKLQKGIKEHIKKTPKLYGMYYGSKEKRENLKADFFSNITITALSYKLASVFGEDNWKQYAEGSITEEYLEGASKKEEVEP